MRATDRLRHGTDHRLGLHRLPGGPDARPLSNGASGGVLRPQPMRRRLRPVLIARRRKEAAPGQGAQLGESVSFFPAGTQPGDAPCGSGSLLLNVRKGMGPHGIGKIYGQEKNITTYNLARMNMLLHGVKDSEFEIFHGDTLTNDWDMLRETNPAKKPHFDAVVANPPFSYRWVPNEALGEDMRFTNHGLAPKSAADFAFLLHGFHYLKDDGVMAIILPHGVLFRGGAEAKIRRKLLNDGHIDTVIGLPANLFYSTGIPVCILVLKKCKKLDDVLFINASEYFDKGKRQNALSDEHIKKIIDTYRQRPKSVERYARRVEMEEIEGNDYNLNISRYVSTAEPEVEVDLSVTHKELLAVEEQIRESTAKHNAFLKELGLSPYQRLIDLKCLHIEHLLALLRRRVNGAWDTCRGGPERRRCATWGNGSSRNTFPAIASRTQRRITTARSRCSSIPGSATSKCRTFSGAISRRCITTMRKTPRQANRAARRDLPGRRMPSVSPSTSPASAAAPVLPTIRDSRSQGDLSRIPPASPAPGSQICRQEGSRSARAISWSTKDRGFSQSTSSGIASCQAANSEHA